MKKTTIAGLLAGIVAAGCAPGGATPPATAAAPAPATPRVTYTPRAEAGIPITASTDAEAFPRLVASRAGTFRPSRDPFALTGEEATFDSLQASERLVAQTGGYSFEYTPPPVVVEEQPVLEPQPYRRLAGIFVADSIMVLVDMGDGQLKLARPGQQIEGTEWRVESVGEETAVLVRSGSRLPRRITVRLESPPAGFAPAGGAPAGGVGPMAPGVGGGGPTRGGVGGGDDN